MDLNITLTIGISEQLVNLIKAIEVVELPIGPGPTPDSLPDPEPTPEPDLVDSPLTTEMPDFPTDKAKRDWLITQLEKQGVEIPPGTRTTTLEKKFEELSGDSTGTDTLPTKAEITKAVQAYINRAESADEKKVRQDKVRAELKKHGAKNITELAEDKRKAVIDALS